MVYPTISAVTPNRDKFGIDLSRGTDVNNYIIFEGNNRYGATTSWKDNRQPDKNVAGIQNLTALIHYPGIDTPVEVPVKYGCINLTLLIQYIKFKLAKPSLEVLGLKICTFRKWRRLTYKRLFILLEP